jgi:quercetin dioxygenase-like cupin family protein
MKHLVAGYENGRSCVTERIEWERDPDAADTGATRVAVVDVAPPDVRPAGISDYRDYGISVGTFNWNRVQWAAGQERPMHFTNTIDSITIIEGSLTIILDDGEHELVGGDSVLINAVDHGWRVGPTGCVSSNILFGTP